MTGIEAPEGAPEGGANLRLDPAAPGPALDPRLSFSGINPRLQIAWDSTSIGALKTCPQYYEYNILKGYAPRRESAHLRFGIEYHAAFEHYDHARAEGQSHEAATKSAVQSALTSTWDSDLERPWTSEEPTKTRDTLIRSVVWYLDKFADDPTETLILANGRPAVELSFRFEPGFTSQLTGEAYLLCGHLDKIAKFNDRYWILDHKTTKSALDEKYFAQYSPDNQISLYSIAGTIILGQPVAGLIINAAQLLVSGTRFQRQPISRTPAQLDEWMKDLSYWLRQAETYARDGYYPKNDKACGNYGGCQYRPICGASHEVRQALLDGMYEKRSWDPLRVRGQI